MLKYSKLLMVVCPRFCWNQRTSNGFKLLLPMLLVVGCSGEGTNGETDLTDGTSTALAGTESPSAANEQPNAPQPNAPEPIDQEPIVQDPIVQDPINQEPIVQVGGVQTVEVEDVIFSSLPEATVNRSSAGVELGRMLFWDPVLSGDQDTACATCHLPEFGYGDGRARSAGTSGVGTGPGRTPGQIGEVPRNAQSVINTIWNGINELGLFDPATAPMFWDNRTESLANQALEPIRSREEMRGDNFSEAEIESVVVSRLNAIPEYQNLFQQAYGSPVATVATIGEALADFQSTLIANNTPFDRWMRGDAAAMSAQQLNGMEVFAETGCAECHSGPMFSDFETHVLGVPEANGLAEPDDGDGNFGFRTPTLRQLAFTGPYFHGGQETDLDEVIDFYDNPNGSDNPNVPNNQLDADFRNLPNLNNNDINAIEAFLDALNDDGFDQSRPASVPSGLPVGGSL